jgi:hypothetical protein
LANNVWMRTRLTVYVPGTTRAQRRALSFHHNWPVAGAVAMIGGTLALGTLMQPPIAAITAAAIYGVIGVMASRLTADLRRASRSIEIAVVPAGDGTAVVGDRAAFESVRRDLLALSADECAGGLRAVDFEARWISAYRQIPPE